MVVKDGRHRPLRIFYRPSLEENNRGIGVLDHRLVSEKLLIPLVLLMQPFSAQLAFGLLRAYHHLRLHSSAMALAKVVN